MPSSTRPTLVRRYGAAAVVMAFDEHGQADTLQRKTEICERAYRILVDELDFPPEDIIFDPNIFAIATGIEEHDNYAVDFIEATRWIKQNLPGAKVSGGVSNVSFSFRGNDPVREAIHTVFLYHAIRAGLDMGIVNAGMVGVYDDLEPVLARACRGRGSQPPARRGRAPDRGGRERQGRGQGRSASASPGAPSRSTSGSPMRWCTASTNSSSMTPKRPTRRIRPQGGAAAARDRRPADGGHERRWRPVRPGQDVPAAGGQERARDEAGRGPPAAVHRGRKEALVDAGGEARAKGKIVIATVKGDVHDIGKNIVTVVLQCNNFEVINMGVMVPCQDILARAKAEGADIIGLSGSDHAQPGGDAACGGRDAARRVFPHPQDAAADRRRHDQPRAHGGEDCAAL